MSLVPGYALFCWTPQEKNNQESATLLIVSADRAFIEEERRKVSMANPYWTVWVENTTIMLTSNV